MGENAQLLDGRAYKGEHTGSVDVGKDVSILWRGNGLTAGGSAPVRAQLLSMQPVMLLHGSRFQSDPVSSTIESINSATTMQARECARQGVLCIHQVNPACAHNNNAIELDHVITATRKHAESLGLPILDSYSPALSRWFATHDGVHYTFSARVVDYPDPPFRWQWQGGVSHMNAMVLVNMLCNGLGSNHSNAQHAQHAQQHAQHAQHAKRGVGAVPTSATWIDHAGNCAPRIIQAGHTTMSDAQHACITNPDCQAVYATAALRVREWQQRSGVGSSLSCNTLQRGITYILKERIEHVRNVNVKRSVGRV